MFLQRKLKALGFQGWSSFDITDEKMFRTVVVYLEHEKIRFLSPEERIPLQKIDSSSWYEAFGSYLVQMENPWPFSTAANPSSLSPPSTG